MTNNSTEIQKSVIAILKTDNKLKAVELFKQNGSSKILWTKSSVDNDINWEAFAAKCGLSSTDISQEQIARDKKVVVGYDSKGTAFYLLNVPSVEEKEISTIVHLQAESRLPLPADQMQLAWRTSNLGNKQMAITIAAARKQQVHKFFEKVRFLNPAQAILDSEGIVNIWKELFSGQEQKAVIVNAGTRNTQVCLAKNGLLCDAVTLDMGIIDFGDSESQEEFETIERLIQDTRSVMDLFGVQKQDEIPVIVLSNGDKIYETLAASLKSAGLNARLATPSIKKLTSDNKLDSKEIFEYRAPIGLALMALNGKADELNLFAQLFKPSVRKLKKRWFYSPQVTGAIAALMLLLFAAVSYAVLAAGSTAINNKLSNMGSEGDINTLVEKQKFFREIANQRADLLELITEITSSGQSNPNTINSQRGLFARNPNPQPVPPGRGGIQLESLHFKKRQRVTITGQAQNKEQLENFEKSLLSNKDIKDVYLTSKLNTGTTGSRNAGGSRGSVNGARGNPQPIVSGGTPGPGGPGNKGFTFTITFNYKNFTVGKSR